MQLGMAPGWSQCACTKAFVPCLVAGVTAPGSSAVPVVPWLCMMRWYGEWVVG